MCWFYVVSLLNKREGDTYDSRCKESSKVFKRFCKINIWDKRLISLKEKTALCCFFENYIQNIQKVYKTKKELMLFLLYHLLNI